MSDRYCAGESAVQGQRSEAVELWFDIDSRILGGVAGSFGFDFDLPVEQQRRCKKLYEPVFAVREQVQDFSACLFATVLGDKISKNHVRELGQEADFAKQRGFPHAVRHYHERAMRFAKLAHISNDEEIRRILYGFEVVEFSEKR